MLARCQVSVVVPLYNEADNVKELYDRLTAVLEGVGRTHELVFVDDGSRDLTFQLRRSLRYLRGGIGKGSSEASWRANAAAGPGGQHVT